MTSDNMQNMPPMPPVYTTDDIKAAQHACDMYDDMIDRYVDAAESIWRSTEIKDPVLRGIMARSVQASMLEDIFRGRISQADIICLLVCAVARLAQHERDR